ncbi:hypothetical protein LTR08_003966 [Meristemomyces frigidus]|nr:hypothetical protein LTR08_003966 [Meristemomyces frigidus]
MDFSAPSVDHPCNVVVRDALLKHESTLLSDLVAKAIKTDNVRSKYTTAAVVMLSKPLPEHVALPIEAQTLFLRLVDRAAESPSAATISPVHALLEGTSTLMLGLLSNDTLLRFEEQLTNIMYNNTRRSSHTTDSLLTLRCLAIMKIVATAADDQLMLTNSFYQTQELLASTQPTSPRWNAEEMRRFFTGGGLAPKTITLLVLQTIGACRASTGSYNERRATLALVNDLATGIPTETRDQWCSSNTAMLQKVQHNALTCETDSSLQMQAFGFVAILCKPVFLQMSVVESIRQAVSQPEGLAHAGAQDVDASWSHCVAAVLDLQTTEKLLHSLLSYLNEASSGDMLDSFVVMTQLIQQLALLADEHQEIAEAAVRALSTCSFTKQLQKLAERARLGKETTILPTSSTTVCGVLWQNARQQVCLELSKFLLTSVLSVHHTEHTVSTSTAALLLSLHAASAQLNHECSHARPSYHPTHTLDVSVEHQSTPDISTMNWREALQSHLSSEARANESSLSKLFAQACRDLEARCAIVEQPLRDERARRDTLQEQYDQLNDAYASLEAQTIDRKLRHDALEVDKDQCVQDLDTTREEADSLLRRVLDLERTMQDLKVDSERRIAELRGAKDAADLQHATAFAKKEEELEDLQERAVAVEGSLASKADELEAVQIDLNDLKAAQDNLRVEAERSSKALQDNGAEVEELQHSARESAAYRSTLEAELQSTTNQLAKDRDAHEQNLRQIQEQYKQNREAANLSHNNLLDRQAAQHGEEVANLEQQLALLGEESSRNTEQHLAELAKCEEEAKDAEQQVVDRLQWKCKQKDQHIAEANSMRSNLMAAMGIGQAIPFQTQSSLPHRTRTPSTRTQHEQDSQLDPSPPSLSSTHGVESQLGGRASIASNASSGHSRNGPTPKRAKPRKSIKAPSPAKARLNTATRAGRTSMTGRSAAARQPLSNKSVNRSPEKDAPRTPSKVVKNDARDGFDDSTVDEHELVAHMSGGKMDIDLSGMLAEDTQG